MPRFPFSAQPPTQSALNCVYRANGQNALAGFSLFQDAVPEQRAAGQGDVETIGGRAEREQ